MLSEVMELRNGSVWISRLPLVPLQGERSPPSQPLLSRFQAAEHGWGHSAPPATQRENGSWQFQKDGVSSLVAPYYSVLYTQMISSSFISPIRDSLIHHSFTIASSTLSPLWFNLVFRHHLVQWFSTPAVQSSHRGSVIQVTMPEP